MHSFIHVCVYELIESERASVVLSLTFLSIYVYIYSVTKILRNIRATTFTENYGKLRVRGDERTPLPISFDSITLYPFTTPKKTFEMAIRYFSC